MSLERWYALLLRAHPRSYREHREDEIMSVLLTAAAPGRVRPTAGEAGDLVLAGARARARMVVADPVATAGVFLAAVLAVAALAVFGQVLALRGQLARSPGGWAAPALPTHVPSWDPVPAGLKESGLGGPAVLAYITGHEDGTRFQMLVGADGRTVRRGGGWLSPDGTRLAAGEAIVDVTTGRSVSLPAGAPEIFSNEYRVGPEWAGSGAWSPDSRRFAWITQGRAQLLDTTAGSWRDLGSGSSVAFTAEEQVAVTDSTGLRLMSTSGTEAARIPLSQAWRLSRAGASPDGSMLALEPAAATTSAASPPTVSAAVSLATGRVTPLAVAGATVAWRGTSSVLVFDEYAPTGAMRALDLRTGREEVVTRISDHEDASGLQVASRLAASVACRK